MNDNDETKNQVFCNILSMLVCLVSSVGGWSAEIPDTG